MSVSPKLIVNIVPVLANSPRVILRDLSETKAGRRTLALLPAAVSRGEWIRTTGLFVPKTDLGARRRQLNLLLQRTLVATLPTRKASRTVAISRV